MAFPPEFMEQLKAANPIADVVGEYVQLKRTGRDYICLCPFHNEKTPSCHIHPDREYFYCFGCHAGGDVINFLMRYHNLDYMETVKMLAERANMEIPDDSNNYTYQSGKQYRTTLADKKRVFEMNREAARFYYRQLFTPGGKGCLNYLINVRGLHSETIKRYGMGYAPNSWTALKDHMLGLGFTEKELLYAHLISSSQKNTKRTFDFYVDRAVFPFIDLRGNILGFSGRTLGGNKRKYINPIDSAFYDKNKYLFSLNIAKNAAVKTGRFILCEGNLDVTTLVQAGFEEAVASCGTGLTEGQLKLMNHYAKEIFICYDSDGARVKATHKAIELIRKCGFKASVITMKGAKDPDEYIKRFGAAAFGVLIDKAETALDFQLRTEREKLDMDTQRGRFDYKDAAVPILARIDKQSEYEYYVGETAREVGVSATAIDEEVKALRNGRRRSEKRREEKAVRDFSYIREQHGAQAALHKGEFNAEEMLITYLYYNPDRQAYLSERLPPEKFVTDFNRRVYSFLLERLAEGLDHSIGSMPEVFSLEEVGRITALLEKRLGEGITDETAEECIQSLLKYKPRQDFGSMSDEEFRALFNNGGS